MKTIAVILLLTVLMACQPSQGSQGNLQPAPGAEIKTFNVEAFQFGYEPSEIRVKQGDVVRIHLTTRDVAHSFSIKQFQFSIPTSPGVPGDGEFIADTAGAFPWRCNIPCGAGHREMGGTLVVE